MKAIILHNKGDANQLKLEEVPTPKINDYEALVKLKAASVNHLDIWVRTGNVPASYPLILGCEGAGDIVEVGKNVKDFKIGDKVLVHPRIKCSQCSYCLAGQDNLCKNAKQIGVSIDGCYAEYVKAPAQNLISLGNVGYEEAAAIPVAYGTAYRILINLAKIKVGETVLITAAGSGVGTAAIQIAKLAGAKVIALAGSDSKLKKAKELGADYTINYNQDDDFDRKVKEITDGDGVDAVLEQVGGDILLKSLKCLKRNGRIIVFGTTSGSVVQLDMQQFYRNNFTLIGSSGTTYKEVNAVFDLVKEEKISPIIDKTFPLKDAGLAHKYMEERKNFGKILLKI